MKMKIVLKGSVLILAMSILLPVLAGGREFYVNTHRWDPYKQHKFRVKWDGKYVPGIFSIDGLHKEFNVVEKNVTGYKKFPLRAKYLPLTLKRGKTHDPEFESWVNAVENYLRSPEDFPHFRKDIIIEILNEANQLTMAYILRGCWPSSYNSVENFDANNTEVAIESIVLEHEGWERDVSVTEPVEN